MMTLLMMEELETALALMREMIWIAHAPLGLVPIAQGRVSGSEFTLGRL